MAGGAEEEQQNFVTQEQLLQLVKDFNTQLTDNMNSIQASMVAEVVKALKASGAVGTHEEELDETNEEYAARLQREEQARRNVHGRGRGGGRGGDVFGRGRGRGRGDDQEVVMFLIKTRSNYIAITNFILVAISTMISSMKRSLGS
jgi:hypothetical protein